MSSNMNRSSSDSLQVSAPYYAQPEVQVRTFPFDPNTADSTQFLALGLAPWQVRAIYKYRSKHGRYHTPEDFKRLPGMTQELWDRLAPSIRIAEKYRYLQTPQRSPRSSYRVASSSGVLRPDSVPADTAAVRDEHVQADVHAGDIRSGRFPRQEKYPVGTKVELNTADTTELKKIPGIASYRARKIVEYRQRLGGFLHVEQVMEACELPDEVLDWFSLDSVGVEQVDVNTASVQRLMHHPYLTFYQARDIVEYRRKYGPFHSVDELLKLDSFDQESLEKVRDYLLIRDILHSK